MADTFLKLDPREQSQIYRGLAEKLSRSPAVLEKDLWVCIVLHALFAMPGRKRMAFKGGTSLSKVFAAIGRFSEDVDVTIDYRELDSSVDPFAESVSNSQIKKYNDNLKLCVQDHVTSVVKPYFSDLLGKRDSASCNIVVSDDGEQLRVEYPSVLDGERGDYLGNVVLVEFGGRNVTDPSSEHTIEPEIAAYLPVLTFPRASVNVLSPSRTFWEKATLIHVACHKATLEAGVQRLSRHWYDLATLADHEIGRDALSDRRLLKDVVRHKKVFFGIKGANYDACLVGQMKLLPEARAVEALREDYERMVEARMFTGPVRSFSDIVDRLRQLEDEINEPENGEHDRVGLENSKPPRRR